MCALEAFDRVVDRYHDAAVEFSRGNPESVKALWSRHDDVTLANPFGPAVRGWTRVAAALEDASSHFSEGHVDDFDVIATYRTPDLLTMLAMERWTMKVNGRSDVQTVDLRVSSTFRCEDGEWRMVHRHADPITTYDPEGPLRGRLS